MASNYRNANRPKNYRKNVIVGNVWEKENIDPDDFNILIFLPDRPPELMQGSDRLPLLEGLDLELTVDRVFGWLLIGK